MNKNELFEAIETNFNVLSENNSLTTKASQQRARKAAGELKKLITAYKSISRRKQVVRWAGGRSFFSSTEGATREFKQPFPQPEGFFIAISCLFVKYFVYLLIYDRLYLF